VLHLRPLHFCTIFLVMFICLIAGCSKNQEHTGPASQTAQSSAPVAPSQPQPPPPAPSSATTTPSAAQPAATPPSATQSTPPALASTDGEMPGVTVAIQDLKRSATAVTLKMVYINRTPKDVDMVWLMNMRRDLGDVHLLDTTGKKKYFVVTDSEGNCVCSSGLNGLSAGAQLPVWAKFPPVPEDVQKITVEVPRFPPLEDIPISR